MTMFLTKLFSPSRKQARPEWLVESAAIKVFDEQVSWNREEVRQQKFQDTLQEAKHLRGLWHPAFSPSDSYETHEYLGQFGIYLKVNWYLYTRKNIVISQRRAEKGNVFVL